MPQSTQPYFSKRPSRLLALWSLVLVLVAGLLILQVLRSNPIGTILGPLT